MHAQHLLTSPSPPSPPRTRAQAHVGNPSFPRRRPRQACVFLLEEPARQWPERQGSTLQTQRGMSFRENQENVEETKGCREGLLGARLSPGHLLL